MKTIRFPTRDGLYDHAAARFETAAGEAVRRRGRFLVAVPGGSTSVALLERIGSTDAIDWGRVHVFWSDECCVPPDDPASHYGAARRALLDRVPLPAAHVHRVEVERGPAAAADAYEVVVRRALAADGKLDLILVSLGGEGQVASLFPRHQALTETDRWILPVHTSAKPPWRVTMTLPLINAARHVLLLAVGPETRRAVGDLEELKAIPASMIRPLEGDLTLVADAEAASLLDG